MKHKTRNPLPPLSSGIRYGQPDENGHRHCLGSYMGMPDTLPDGGERDLPCTLRLVKLPWVDGDYIPNGAYFGNSRDGSAIYRAIGDCGETRAELFIRASDRTEAKELVRESLPNARFYN